MQTFFIFGMIYGLKTKFKLEIFKKKKKKFKLLIQVKFSKNPIIPYKIKKAMLTHKK